jgi:hypothetical protein
MTTPPSRRFPLARAVLRWLGDPMAATSIQRALAEQKRQDVADHVSCGACGGLGVVVDTTNKIPTDDFGSAPGGYVYGGKRCPDCGGSGVPR